jgi:ADP-ribose pyrophosphatase YjhB (NUDIX family)
MELIREISEKDINPSYIQRNNIRYKLRKAARAVLLNQGKIALLWVTNENYHKLPGGGVEENENIKDTLHRELGEEAGCEIDIVRQLGLTIEYRDQINQLQISYVYLTKVFGEPNQPVFTKDEKEAGFTLKWVALNEVESLMSKDNPTGYVDKFISFRDKEILRFYQKSFGKA